MKPAPDQPREGTVTLTRAANGASPNGGLAAVAVATEEARQGPYRAQTMEGHRSIQSTVITR